MSKADKMFEELGYEKDKNYSTEYKEKYKKIMNKEEIEAITEAKKQIEEAHNLNDINVFMTDSTTLKTLLSYIDRLQKELDNRIPKEKIANTLRKVQDYDLTYKDIALFNIINQELLGNEKWENIE